MKRILLRLVLAGFVLIVGSALWAEDVVYFQEPGKKKEESAKGIIERESPAGIQLKVGKNSKNIPAAQITQVVYGHKDVDSLAFRRSDTQLSNALKETRPAKRTEHLLTALNSFRDLDAKTRDDDKIHRYLQYRIALTLAAQAKDAPASRDAAIAALKDNKALLASGWEVVPALQLLARLQEEKGDTEGAGQTYADLADVPGLSAAMKLDSQLRGARLLLSARKFTDAESKLKALTASMSSGDPQRAYIEVYLAQSRIAQNNLDGIEKQLKDALRTGEDKKLRGLAHNALGDYYRAKGNKELAFWEYLKVDTLYSEDREEQAKALYYLSELFDMPMNNRARAEECRAKLQSHSFDGTFYQGRASAKEKKP